MKKILTFLAAFFCITAAFAQDIKIVTGHPDFKVKATRCEASGKNVVLDLVFTNVSTEDVENWSLCPGQWGYGQVVVYDIEGNIYDGRSISIKVSNGEYQKQGYYNLKMITDVPMKVSLMITDVPSSVESLARVDLEVSIPQFNIQNKPIKIKNIPITR